MSSSHGLHVSDFDTYMFISICSGPDEAELKAALECNGEIVLQVCTIDNAANPEDPDFETNHRAYPVGDICQVDDSRYDPDGYSFEGVHRPPDSRREEGVLVHYYPVQQGGIVDPAID